MKTIKLILLPIFVAVLSVVLSTVALAEDFSAPFGLKWGASKLEVQNLGVLLVQCSDEGAYEQCNMDSLPKNAPNVDSYGLSFSSKYGLIKVVYFSNNFFSDSYGTEGKAAYVRIKRQLSGKHGTPTSNESEGKSSDYIAQYFYECLQNKECGEWTSTWFKTGGGLIELSLRHLSLNAGYIALIYESSNYNKAIEEHAEDTF